MPRWQLVHVKDRKVRFYLSQPSPNRWSAVGVLYGAAGVDMPAGPRMVVGNGRTEQSAITDLVNRAEQLMTLPVAEFSSPKAESARVIATARRPVTRRSRQVSADPISAEAATQDHIASSLT